MYWHPLSTKNISQIIVSTYIDWPNVHHSGSVLCENLCRYVICMYIYTHGDIMMPIPAMVYFINDSQRYGHGMNRPLIIRVVYEVNRCGKGMILSLA